MAEEFYKFLEKARGQPIEEKIKKFGEIVEKIMHLTLSIPDIFDKNLIEINKRIDFIEGDINSLNDKVSDLETQIEAQKEKQEAVKKVKKPEESEKVKDLKKPPDLSHPQREDKPPVRKQSTRKILMDELKRLFSQNVKGIFIREEGENVLIKFSNNKEVLIPKSKIYSDFTRDKNEQTFLIEANILRKNNIID